jgi:hypothetical protein
MWFIISLILLSIANVHKLVPIGANMDFLLYSSRSQPYVNLVRQAHAWDNASSPDKVITTVNPKTG